MKPIVHARLSAKRYGGKPEDYLFIHDEMDSTKAAFPSIQHRAIYHSAFGVYIIEKMFGTTMVNSDNKEVSVRDIAENHVQEDIGFIPTLERWIKNIPLEPWMAGGVKFYRKESMPQPVTPEGQEQVTID